MKLLRVPHLVWIALFCTVFALAACGKKDEGPAAKAEKPTLPQDVQPVADALTEAGVLPSEKPAAAAPSALTATGEFVSPHRSDLVPRWPGRVEAVLAEEGDTVRRGQPLLRLETDYLRLNVQRSEAELERAKAASAEAANDLRRKQELMTRGSIPQATFDRAKSMADQAQAAVAGAESAVALGQRQVGDAVVSSPIDGVIAERRIEVGERVSEGTVTFVIVGVAPLRLRFQLPERHLAALKAGDTVHARIDAWPEERFAGKVMMLGQVIDPATRTFAVEAEFPNQDRRLRPGLFARVELASGG